MPPALQTLLVAIAFFAGVMILALVLKRLGLLSAPPETLPYERVESLLTAGERPFYAALRVAVHGRHAILAKVRLEDLVHVRAHGRDRMSARGRVKSRHVDFVICTPDALVPLAAIELDDSSHDRADRVERDEFVDRVFQTIGLPLLRVKTASRYDPEEIARRLAAAVAPASGSRRS
jgi:hypothetical protein